MQLAFEYGTTPGLDEAQGERGFRDPAFMANRAAPVHRWVPWIAGYSQQFVEDALSQCIDDYLQGVQIPTDRFLAKIAERQGFEVRKIHAPRNTRVGNSIIDSTVRAGKAANGARLYESVVELRRRP